MSNLDDILRMFTDSTDKKDNIINNFSELKRLGKSQLQALISGKTEPEKQQFNKDSNEELQGYKDRTDRKSDSNKIIMKGTSQNNYGSQVKNNLNVKEIFSYDFTDEDLVKGFIFSEVLGRPKSKSRDKNFRGRRAR